MTDSERTTDNEEPLVQPEETEEGMGEDETVRLDLSQLGVDFFNPPSADQIKRRLKQDEE